MIGKTTNTPTNMKRSRPSSQLKGKIAPTMLRPQDLMVPQDEESTIGIDGAP